VSPENATSGTVDQWLSQDQKRALEAAEKQAARLDKLNGAVAELNRIIAGIGCAKAS
jgi:hypothetical protein